MLSPSDSRPADVLRLIGAGWSASDAALELGINRKTITRWGVSLDGFGEALARARALSREKTDSARAEIDKIVASWTPGGLVGPDGPDDRVPPAEVDQLPEVEAEPVAVAESVSEPVAEPEAMPTSDAEPEASEPEVAAVLEPVVEPVAVVEPEPALLPEQVCAPEEPEVIGLDGRVIVSRALPAPPDGGRAPAGESYTSKRPPTQAEWAAMMAELAMDKSQPERLRAVAIASVSSALFGGPGARVPRQGEPSPVAEAAVQEAARERGRDAGVPASVWQEARKNFLGPAPEPERREAAGERDEQPAESSTA